MSVEKLTYVDLFAGAGGLSIGLERAGFELKHAVELNEDARATFVNNRENITHEDITGDITQIDSTDIPEVVGRDNINLVAGGPPCQGFSEVVSPDGSDERNHLFTYFIDWVNKLRPTAALFENVRGMQKTADGKFFDAIKHSFNNIGYEINSRVVTASDFGVPQHRRRLLVLATKSEIQMNPLEGFEINPVETPGVIDGIGDLPELAAGKEDTVYAQEPQTVLQQDLRGECDKLTAHEAANHSDDMVEMISHIPDGGNRTAIPDDIQPESGYHNSYSRLNSKKPAVAITSNMSKPSSARCIHPFQHRGLTPREGARLQTFPDSYSFDGGLVSTRRQIGNAVPPYLAESLGYYLKQGVYNRELSKTDRNRVATIRCGALIPESNVDKQKSASGLTQQATLTQGNLTQE